MYYLIDVEMFREHCSHNNQWPTFSLYRWQDSIYHFLFCFICCSFLVQTNVDCIVNQPNQCNESFGLQRAVSVVVKYENICSENVWRQQHYIIMHTSGINRFANESQISLENHVTQTECKYNNRYNFLAFLMICKHYI